MPYLGLGRQSRKIILRVWITAGILCLGSFYPTKKIFMELPTSTICCAGWCPGPPGTNSISLRLLAVSNYSKQLRVVFTAMPGSAAAKGVSWITRISHSDPGHGGHLLRPNILSALETCGHGLEGADSLPGTMWPS